MGRLPKLHRHASLDTTCPWNQDACSLTVKDGEAECRPATSPPDITAPAEALGVAYLGGKSLLKFADAISGVTLAAAGVAIVMAGGVRAGSASGAAAMAFGTFLVRASVRAIRGLRSSERSAAPYQRNFDDLDEAA